MKRFITLGLVALLLTGCQRAPENPLLGRWKSDEKATLVEARGSGTLTDAQLQQLENEKVFGKLVASIDNDKIVFEYEGKLDPSPYRIIKVEQPFVDIELFNSSTKTYETTRIEIHGDRIWVPTALVDFREVFVRID
jgi:hypothetical protein